VQQAAEILIYRGAEGCCRCKAVGEKRTETFNTVTLAEKFCALRPRCLPGALLEAMKNAESKGNASPGLSRTQPASPSRYSSHSEASCYVVVALCFARAPHCSMPTLRTMHPQQTSYAICCDLEPTALGAAGPGQPLLARVLPHYTAVSAHSDTSCTSYYSLHCAKSM
jgi:hypothetical protein